MKAKSADLRGGQKMCKACGLAYNARNFCLPCYERVVREKPLDAWKANRYKRAGYVVEVEAEDWIASLEG